ncbi:MAG: HEAT repeat domain-containing protein [Planctomycetota bacterium]|nr:HEAT repeat domain-containing protein [Planctomycetota bacterium]
MIQSALLLLATSFSPAYATEDSGTTRLPVYAVQRFDSQWVLRANEVLIEKRLRGRVLEDVAAELAGFGPSAIQAYFAILAGTVDGPTAEGASRPSPDAIDPNAVLFAALGRMNPREVAAHVAAAASGEASIDVRLVAMRVLECVGANGGFDAWAQILDGVLPEQFSRAYVQGPCERALAAVVSRDGSSISGLKTRLQKLAPALQPLVLRALAASRRPQAVGVLTAFLGQSHDLDLVVLSCVGRLVEEALGDLPEEDLTWIRPFAEDTDWRVRREAMLVLGRVSDWRSHAVITRALADEQRLVQQAAHWALARMTRADFAFDAGAWSTWFEHEIVWYELNGPRFERAIASQDPADVLEGVRELAGHTLFRHDAARTIATLLASPQSDLVAQVCLVLHNLRSPAACPALLAALESVDASIREAARATLAVITGLELAPDPVAWKRALVGT